MRLNGYSIGRYAMASFVSFRAHSTRAIGLRHTKLHLAYMACSHCNLRLRKSWNYSFHTRAKGRCSSLALWKPDDAPRRKTLRRFWFVIFANRSDSRSLAHHRFSISISRLLNGCPTHLRCAKGKGRCLIIQWVK